ncbi:MAG: gamma-glutamylcyclotransferase [Pseudomonadota bacterium]
MIDQDFWVFAYGSLIWQPGFAFEESVKARLTGYHRSLCLYSHVSRGTPETPGLVLGLARGGECFGFAYRVAEDHVDETLDALRKREMIAPGYHEITHLVALMDGSNRSVNALCYVIDETSYKYAGGLRREEMLFYIRQGVGSGGTNIEYVTSTLKHLHAAGIADEELEWVCRETASG